MPAVNRPLRVPISVQRQMSAQELSSTIVPVLQHMRYGPIQERVAVVDWDRNGRWVVQVSHIARTGWERRDILYFSESGPAQECARTWVKFGYIMHIHRPNIATGEAPTLGSSLGPVVAMGSNGDDF